MKILVLMTDPYGGHGGIAQYNRDVLDALAAMPEVTQIVSLPRLVPSTDCVLPAKLEEHFNARSIAGYLWQGLTLALRQKPDVILCGHINLLPLAAIIKKALGIPLVIELYGIDVWSPKPSIFHDWSIRQVDLAISISRFTRQKFLAWASVSPARVKVVPNAIHLDQYVPASKPDYLQDRYCLQGKKVLLTLGRLSASERYKGQDRIIQLMPGLLKQRPDLAYLIAGDGDDRGRLEALAGECGVSDQVHFIGRVPNEEMMDLYNLADAFAMPSIGEGFGFVFLEAAACGVPVLGGGVDGSPDALADGRLGIMVDPDDGKALNEGLLRLLDQPKAVPADLAMYDFALFKHQIRQLILPMCSSLSVTRLQPVAS
ncbi:MAG: glycosyltransferase family 4 protein [Sulfuricellaceae bacterium]|nr:glycosyltransferase family 4 protein [Sulfuricellaceae bacterium]